MGLEKLAVKGTGKEAIPLKGPSGNQGFPSLRERAARMGSSQARPWTAPRALWMPRECAVVAAEPRGMLTLWLALRTRTGGSGLPSSLWSPLINPRPQPHGQSIPSVIASRHARLQHLVPRSLARVSGLGHSGWERWAGSCHITHPQSRLMGPAAPRLPGPVCPLQLGTQSVHPLSKVPPQGPPEQRLR